jgi:hypothetical protein
MKAKAVEKVKVKSEVEVKWKQRRRSIRWRTTGD